MEVLYASPDSVPTDYGISQHWRVSLGRLFQATCNFGDIVERGDCFLGGEVWQAAKLCVEQVCRHVHVGTGPSFQDMYGEVQFVNALNKVDFGVAWDSNSAPYHKIAAVSGSISIIALICKGKFCPL